jgi:transposase InsO family protein
VRPASRASTGVDATVVPCATRIADPGSDLVTRRFSVEEPNRLWVTDITAHPTREGTVSCVAVMDAYSRLIVGWSIAEHMRTELVTDALGMAILRRPPDKRSSDDPATTQLYTILTTVATTRPGRSGNACAPPDFSPPWARSATATTTP